MHCQITQCLLGPINDAPPNSLKDLNASPKVKIMKEEGVEVHSLIHITLGVRGV